MFSFFPAQGRLVQYICLFVPLFILSILGAVSIGATAIPIATSFDILAVKILGWEITPYWSVGVENIIWQIRFPRALLAAIVGGGLAVAGLVLQAITRNLLADPHLLGISAGASAGAVLALLHTGLILGMITVPVFAFVGALLAACLVLYLSWRLKSQGHGADKLILIGVAVSFVIMAFANILIFLGDPRAAHTVVFWMLGGLGLAQWSHLLYPILALTGCCVIFYLSADKLTAMILGDETAQSLGIYVPVYRMAMFTLAAFLTASLVAFSGMIGFVGLMVPHIMRRLYGPHIKNLIIPCVWGGAIFLIWCDVAARSLMAPEDMPIGILTGALGGGFFLWLLSRPLK